MDHGAAPVDHSQALGVRLLANLLSVVKRSFEDLQTQNVCVIG
jgi:hypothetical protein